MPDMEDYIPDDSIYIKANLIHAVKREHRG